MKTLKLNRKLILASNSPRRKELMTQAGFEFDILVRPTEETWPTHIPTADIAGYLAIKKAKAFDDFNDSTLILCADTIVVIDNEVLNKPSDKKEAQQMLQKLSGRSHIVYTGVCLKEGERYKSIVDQTIVEFKKLTDWEIDYYIENCKPFDKAGSYGVQDFIGMAGITELKGSFFTVMGLPVHKVYELLEPFLVR